MSNLQERIRALEASAPPAKAVRAGKARLRTPDGVAAAALPLAVSPMRKLGKSRNDVLRDKEGRARAAEARARLLKAEADAAEAKARLAQAEAEAAEARARMAAESGSDSEEWSGEEGEEEEGDVLAGVHEVFSDGEVPINEEVVKEEGGGSFVPRKDEDGPRPKAGPVLSTFEARRAAYGERPSEDEEVSSRGLSTAGNSSSSPPKLTKTLSSSSGRAAAPPARPERSRGGGNESESGPSSSLSARKDVFERGASAATSDHARGVTPEYPQSPIISCPAAFDKRTSSLPAPAFQAVHPRLAAVSSLPGPGENEEEENSEESVRARKDAARRRRDAFPPNIPEAAPELPELDVGSVSPVGNTASVPFSRGVAAFANEASSYPDTARATGRDGGGPSSSYDPHSLTSGPPSGESLSNKSNVATSVAESPVRSHWKRVDPALLPPVLQPVHRSSSPPDSPSPTNSDESERPGEKSREKFGGVACRTSAMGSDIAGEGKTSVGARASAFERDGSDAETASSSASVDHSVSTPLTANPVVATGANSPPSLTATSSSAAACSPSPVASLNSVSSPGISASDASPLVSSMDAVPQPSPPLAVRLAAFSGGEKKKVGASIGSKSFIGRRMAVFGGGSLSKEPEPEPDPEPEPKPEPEPGNEKVNGSWVRDEKPRSVSPVEAALPLASRMSLFERSSGTNGEQERERERSRERARERDRERERSRERDRERERERELEREEERENEKERQRERNVEREKERQREREREEERARERERERERDMERERERKRELERELEEEREREKERQREEEREREKKRQLVKEREREQERERERERKLEEEREKEREAEKERERERQVEKERELERELEKREREREVEREQRELQRKRDAEKAESTVPRENSDIASRMAAFGGMVQTKEEEVKIEPSSTLPWSVRNAQKSQSSNSSSSQEAKPAIPLDNSSIMNRMAAWEQKTDVEVEKKGDAVSSGKSWKKDVISGSLSRLSEAPEKSTDSPASENGKNAGKPPIPQPKKSGSAFEKDGWRNEKSPQSRLPLKSVSKPPSLSNRMSAFEMEPESPVLSHKQKSAVSNRKSVFESEGKEPPPVALKQQSDVFDRKTAFERTEAESPRMTTKQQSDVFYRNSAFEGTGTESPKASSTQDSNIFERKSAYERKEKIDEGPKLAVKPKNDLINRKAAFESTGVLSPKMSTKQRSDVFDRKSPFEKSDDSLVARSKSAAPPAFASRMSAFETQKSDPNENIMLKKAPPVSQLAARMSAFETIAAAEEAEEADVEEARKLATRKSIFERSVEDAADAEVATVKAQRDKEARSVFNSSSIDRDPTKQSKNKESSAVYGTLSGHTEARGVVIPPATKVVDGRAEIAELKRTNAELVSALMKLMSACTKIEKSKEELKKRIGDLEKKAVKKAQR